MIIVLGLVILVVAVVVAVAGVFSNLGSGHGLTHTFSVLGHHVTGSTGTLFLYGIVVGAVGLFGLSLLLTAARRTSRRGGAARSDLRQSRQDTAAVREDRDSLIDQRESARAYASVDPGANGSPPSERNLGRDNGARRGGLSERRPHGEQLVTVRTSGDLDQSTGSDPVPERVVTP
ncbi:MAG: hypothetical protein ACYCST_14610 [Acidimicrobiales bacterium]